MSCNCLLPLATPLTILGTAIVAWQVQKRIALRRATIDFISRLEVGSREWREAKRLFAMVTSDPKQDRLLDLLDDSDRWEDVLVIASLLGHFEAVAVAIRYKAISEPIYKEWNRGSYIAAWQKSRCYVEKLRKRKDRPMIYRNFQDLAEKWTQEGAP